MNFEELDDFVKEATEEIAQFKIPFILSPPKMMADDYNIDVLNWDAINFGSEEKNKIPNNKRGIYAFGVVQESTILPPHGYILYVGIAGHKSKRALRDRYGDYLNAKKVAKRPKVARMISTWRKVLKFYFAPVDDDFSSEDLRRLEGQLNTALMTPFSENDLDTNAKKQRRAFS